MELFDDKKQYIANNILLTLEDVADLFDVPTNTVRNWANTGELQSLPIDPRLDLRFRMNDVIAFVLKQIKRELGMEKTKEEIDEEARRYNLKLGYLVSTFDTHVDEAKQLIRTGLLPYVYEYTDLCSNPRPESRVRYEDFRFILPK